MAGLYASLTPTVPAIIPPDMKKFYAGMARDYSKALIASVTIIGDSDENANNALGRIIPSTANYASAASHGSPAEEIKLVYETLVPIATCQFLQGYRLAGEWPLLWISEMIGYPFREVLITQPKLAVADERLRAMKELDRYATAHPENAKLPAFSPERQMRLAVWPSHD